MGTPMEGFFGGVEFATPATSVATHGVPVKTSTFPTESIPIDEGTHTGEVSEVIASPAETLCSKGSHPSCCYSDQDYPDYASRYFHR